MVKMYEDEFEDKSKLFKAWREYYSHLSFNKQLTVVPRKVNKGKMPPAKTKYK